MREPTPCLVWHAAERFGLVRDVVRLAGLRVEAAGSPERGRGVSELWPGDVRPADDLRAAIAASNAELALLASPEGFGSDPADASAVEAFVRRGGKVLSFEALPPGMGSLSAGWDASVDGTPLSALVGFAGEARATPAIRAALEALEHFGPVAALAVNATAGPDAGSLGARLLSAMELVYLIAGEPEFINASVSQPRAGRDEGLWKLDGTLTASIRFADHRTATVLASGANEPWHRGITVLGPAGRMRVWDEGFAWTGPDGTALDEHRADEAGRDAGGADEGGGPAIEPPAVGEAGSRPHRPAPRHIAAAIANLLAGQPPRVYATTVLAMAETALLSVRTGSAESPAMMRRVAERP
jgi:hypothetical protein